MANPLTSSTNSPQPLQSRLRPIRFVPYSRGLRQAFDSDKENLVEIRRPASIGWLLRPAWIDGGTNPPQFYHDNDEINEVRAVWGYGPVDPPPRRAATPAVDPSLYYDNSDYSANTGSPGVASQETAALPLTVDAERAAATPEQPGPAHLSMIPATAAALPAPPVPAVSAAAAAAPISPPAVAGPATTVVAGTGPLGAPDATNEGSGQLGPTQSCIVHVGVVFSQTCEKPGARGKSQVVRKTVSKSNRLPLHNDITRVVFINQCLEVHDLHRQYTPGPASGPRFTVSWTGKSGGKNNAATIDQDNNWTNSLQMILEKMVEKKGKVEVQVEFDLDVMNGFRAVQPLDLMLEPHAELVHGTQVPQVAQFTEEEQLHGKIILSLKKRWLCHAHSGEHGEPGLCYINAAGEHFGLNPRRLKIWAAAIASLEYTIHMPPSAILDNGSRDVQPSADTLRSRGRTGPRPLQTMSMSSDNTAMLTAAVLASLVDRLTGESPSLGTGSSHGNSWTRRPIPTPGQELHACLLAFHSEKSIDLGAAEPALQAHEFTPDIIPDIPASELAQLLGIVEGRIRKFQAFCQTWYSDIQRSRVVV